MSMFWKWWKRKPTRKQLEGLEELGEFALFGLQMLACLLTIGIILECCLPW